MGEKKRRGLNLLGQQPLCIFCGGATPASTVDHQPARSFFDAKLAPEGYEFPACEPCNKKSKDQEHVLTTLVRLKQDGQQNSQREVDFAKYAKAMKNNFPGLLRVLGPNEKQGFVKSRGVFVPVGRAFPLQLPMVTIDPKIAGAAVDGVFRKLMCALHYKHTGNILPADAEITVKWSTNAGLPDFLTDEMKAFIAGLTEKPTLVRNGKDLSDQFDYRYKVADDLSASAFFIKFRQSLFGAGVVLSKPGAGAEDDAAAKAAPIRASDGLPKPAAASSASI
ncbi:hypothetical protein [Bradyrhizobium sp. SZCCHNR1039]|uniref:hypothetical protein n=1 Tax=Bradyrhizobium sp. SZCCHNR1039 TaxID=3057350 RepID=UPI002915FEAF|nr:hypothetical protein [Bradyrhizobium sp. SZCCHNR1039]